jgi:hypothetical protein
MDRPHRPEHRERPEVSPRPERAPRSEETPGRDRDTRGERSERFDRDTRGEGWRRERPARTDEPAPERAERRPERDTGGVEGRPAHPRSGEGRDRERGRPAGREDRGERGRGRGRDDRPARSSMPMAEFGDGDEELNAPPEASPPGDIGELESIDNVLGETPRGRGDRPRGPRRPRR